MELYLVHADPQGSHFERAARREIALFYDPEGGAPKGVLNEAEFLRRARYWVTPANALRLQKLLEEKADSNTIIAQLGLYYRDPYAVRNEMDLPQLVPAPRNRHHAVSGPSIKYRTPLALLVPEGSGNCEKSSSSDDDGGFICPVI